MKKFKKIIICIFLIIATAVSMSSCNLLTHYLRKGDYTGGLHVPDRSHYFSITEVHWVETYEEAILAIEHLQAAGNKVRALLSTYENEYVDAKYVFRIHKDGSKKLEKGQMWYDREEIQSTVSVYYIGFLDKITIEELEYSYFDEYRSFEIRSASDAFDPTADVDYHYSDSSANTFSLVQGGKVKMIFDTYNVDAKDLVETLVPGFSTDFPKSIVYIGE